MANEHLFTFLQVTSYVNKKGYMVHSNREGTKYAYSAAKISHFFMINFVLCLTKTSLKQRIFLYHFSDWSFLLLPNFDNRISIELSKKMNFEDGNLNCKIEHIQSLLDWRNGLWSSYGF